MNELLSPGTPEEVVPLNELMPPVAPTTGLPEASARNRAATAALFTEDVQGNYNAIMAENQQGQTGIVDKTEERAKNAGQQLDTATMMNILGDKNVPFEEKKRLIGEFSKRPAFDLKTELFNKALESDPKLPADAAVAQVTMAQQAQKWKDSAEQIDKMLNAFYASRDSSTMKGISDVAAAVIPFSGNIVSGRISKGEGNSLWQSLKDGAWQPGYKQKLKDKFNLLPPDERVAFVSNLIKSVEENAGVIFPGSNHYAAYQFMREITEEGHYTNTGKLIDAAATVLDAIGMGYTLRSAKGALKGVTKTPLKPLPEGVKPLPAMNTAPIPSKKNYVLEAYDQAKRIELNAPIRVDRPSTPLHVFAQTNPEKYRATIAAVAADTTDETAKAAAAATRTETLASAVMPQVVTSSGRVTAKVIDPFKDIAPLDEEIKHVMEGAGSLHFERPEVARAQENFTKAFTSEAEGIHAVDGMGGFSITQDGAAFNISAVYGTKAGAFSNAQEAVDQTKLALRGKGVDDSHIVLMKKDGLDYTPTTLADEAGKEGSYMVKLEGRFPFDYHDIGNFEGYDVKRNFFDSVISVDKGHASRNFLDPASMLPPVFTESMGTALDRVARVDKAFLRMADDYAYKVKGFTSKRRKAIDDYLKKANEQSIPFNRSELASKEGFSPEEIDAIHTWKVLGDQRWYAENADEVKTLIRDNWQKYVSKTGDEYIARPIGQSANVGKIPIGLNQTVGRVFDPITGTSEFVIKAETDMWYKAGGTYAELRRPVDINGELVTHIRVQNSTDGYLRKLNSNDQVLNYKPMHYTRYYKSPIWVDEIVDGHRRAIAVGPDIPSAEHHIARMKKENPNKEYVRRNDARGQLAGANDKWDIDSATGRIAQRHRGKLLGTTDGTAILGDGSFVLDPTNSAIRAAQSLAGRISTREVIETAKARVVAQYGHMFPDGKFPSSVDAIYSKGNFTGSDVAAARTSVGNILYLEDAHINFVDTFYKNSMNRIANKLGEMGAGTAERVVRVGEDISPTQSTRSLAFHAHVVLGNPVRQYFLQSLAATLRTAAYNPKNLFGGKAFSDTSRFTLSRLDPTKADDFTRFVDEAGIVSSVDKHTLVNGALSDVAEHRNLLVKGVRGLLIDIPRRIGFDAGENTGQLMWHSAVYRRMQEQGLDMTKKDNIQKAASLVRAYTGEANKAGELAYNSGSLSLITQFLQMPHKAGLMYTNRKVHADVTKTHLLAMGAVDLALWGAPVGVVSQVLAGDILPDDDELRYAVSQGLTAYVLNRMYKTAFGTSEPDMDFSWLSPYGYDGFTKKIFAALDGRVDDLIKSAPAYSLLSPEQGRIPIAIREMYRMFSGEVEEGMPEATMRTVLQRTLEISGGYSHASRAAAALQSHQHVDKFGRPLIGETTPGTIFMAGFGVGTLDQKQAYALAFDQNENIKKFKEDVEQDYKETRRILTAAAASGDPDEFRIGREATNIMLSRYANNYEAKKMIIQMWKRDTMDPEDKLMLKAYKYANVPGVHLLDDQLKMAPLTDEQKQLIRNRQKDLIEHLESPNKE